MELCEIVRLTDGERVVPLTLKEQALRAALATSFNVPLPLSDEQAYWLEQMAPYLLRLPQRMRRAVVRFVLCGVAPTGFVLPLLSNDLMATFAQADAGNIEAMPEWTQLLQFAVPPACYGSPSKVEEWILAGGLASPNTTVIAALRARQAGGR